MISINFFLLLVLYSPTSALIVVLKVLNKFLKAPSKPDNCFCNSSFVTKSFFSLDLDVSSLSLFSRLNMFSLLFGVRCLEQESSFYTFDSTFIELASMRSALISSLSHLSFFASNFYTL